MLKKIIHNTLANYLLKALHLLLNLVAVPVLIDGVGVEGFGIITFAAVIVGYFNVFDLGITQGVTKYVSEFLANGENKKVSEVINTSFGLFFIIGLLICFTVLIGVQLDLLKFLKLSEVNYSSSRSVFVLAAFLAIFMWPRLVLEGAFRGLQDFTTLNLVVGIGRVFSILVAIILTKYFEASILLIFLAINFDKVVVLFVLYFLLRKKIQFWSFKWSEVNIKTFKIIFAFSVWVMFSNIAILLEYQIDQFILVSFIGVSAVTTYVVVFYLFTMLQSISGLACSAIMPVVSKVNAEGNKLLVEKFIYNGSRYHNILFSPFIIVLYFISEPFIKIWIGDTYLEYIWLVKLTILFQLLWQSNAFLGSIYYGLGISKKIGILSLLIGLGNAIVSVILTYFLGFPGVILGTIIVGTISIPFEFIWIFPVLNVNLKKYLYNVFIKAKIPFIIFILLLLPVESLFNNIESWSQLLLIGGLFIMITYYVGYLFCIDSNEKLLFKKLIKKEMLNIK